MCSFDPHRVCPAFQGETGPPPIGSRTRALPSTKPFLGAVATAPVLLLLATASAPPDRPFGNQHAVGDPGRRGAKNCGGVKNCGRNRAKPSPNRMPLERGSTPERQIATAASTAPAPSNSRPRTNIAGTGLKRTASTRPSRSNTRPSAASWRSRSGRSPPRRSTAGSGRARSSWTVYRW